LQPYCNHGRVPALRRPVGGVGIPVLHSSIPFSTIAPPTMVSLGLEATYVWLGGVMHRTSMALRLRTYDVLRLATRQASNGLIERGGDELGLVHAGRVVGVAHRRLDIPVTHPLLQRADRDPGRGHLGSEGVSEVVEAMGRVEPRRTERSPVAQQHHLLVERLASQRVNEDELVVARLAC